MDSLEQRKLLSAVCHGAILFSSTLVTIGIPIAILFLSTDSIVKDNARESLNFHINLYIYALIFSILIFAFVGIPLLIILGLVSWVMPIIAIVNVVSEPDRPYRYPFILRLV